MQLIGMLDSPYVRRVAVATDNDPDLINVLPELLRSDPDASVRLAALKRLDDYEFWRERSTNDSDGALRRTARAAYLSQLWPYSEGALSDTRRDGLHVPRNNNAARSKSSQTFDRGWADGTCDRSPR